jgi:hypothetical protein
MPLDLKKLTDQELDALEAGDLTGLSDATLNQLEKDAAEEERAKRTTQIPTSAFSMARPDVYGATFAPEPETVRRGATAALRYGAPLAVGVATGGIGFLPAIATGLTAGAAETAAQLIEQGAGEREKMALPEIGAATVGAAAPVIQVAGAPIRSFVQTLVGQLAAGESSRYIQKGKFELPQGDLGEVTKEAVLRWGLPIGASALAKYGSELEQAKINLAEVAKEGRRPIVMDAIPRLGPLEAKVFQKKGSLARQYADEMEASLGDIIKNAYGDLPPQSQSEIAAALTPYVGKYDELKAAADAARQTADKADEALKVAEATRSSELAQIRAAAEVAQNEKVLAENNFAVMKDSIFGSRTPILTSEASVGALEQRMKAVAKAAEQGVESSLDALYSNAGLRPNDVVVRKADVLRSIQTRTAQGRAFEGGEASAQARKAVELFFGDAETATLEQLRNFKQIIADKIPQGGPSDLAGRYASALYDSLKKSSNKYLRDNYPEEVYKAFNQAQNLAAANFAKRGTSALDALREGRFDEFYTSLKEKGKLGAIATELDAYANALSRMTGAAIRSGQVGTASDIAAINVARQFKNDVNNIILNGIINESVVGRSGGLNKVVDVIDPKKLIETLGYFESQGFKLNQLGVRGSDVQKLVKANAMVGKEPLTVERLNEFLSLVPSVGGDVAAARLAYRQAVANAMIESGAKERAAAFQKASNFAKKSGISAKEAEQLFLDASAEPLTQFFKENGSMMLNKGALQNSNWIDTIVTKDSDVIGRFVDALQAQGKNDVLGKMREAAITHAVKRFLPDISGKGQKVDAEAILAPFISNSREMQMQRQNLKKILGNDAYNQLQKTVIEPVRKVLVNRAALGQPVYDLASDLKAAVSAQALATGRATAGTLFSNAVVNTANAAQEHFYNVVSRIWLNPKYSSELIKAGYDINRFMQMSDRNRIAVELAMRDDEREQQESLRQKYIK